MREINGVVFITLVGIKSLLFYDYDYVWLYTLTITTMNYRSIIIDDKDGVSEMGYRVSRIVQLRGRVRVRVREGMMKRECYGKRVRWWEEVGDRETESVDLPGNEKTFCFFLSVRGKYGWLVKHPCFNISYELYK